MKQAEPEYIEGQTKSHHWAVENAAPIGLLIGIILGAIVGVATDMIHQAIMVLMVTGLTIGTLILIMTSSEDA